MFSFIQIITCISVTFFPLISRLKEADGSHPVRARPLSSQQSAEKDFCLPCRADLAEGGIPLFDCPTVPEYINENAVSIIQLRVSSSLVYSNHAAVLIDKRTNRRS